MMQGTTPRSTARVSPPKVARRIAAMRELEGDFQSAGPRDQQRLHVAGAFYWLLSDLERAALARRFEDELGTLNPTQGSDERVRITWDRCSRILVREMLEFADAVDEVGMVLVNEVGPHDDVAVMALTTSGSLLEIDRPKPDGTRYFSYLSRSSGERSIGEERLAGSLGAGLPARLGANRTSGLLLIATGPELPFTDEDEWEELSQDEVTVDDPIREGFATIREVAKASRNASGAFREALHDKATAVATLLQQVFAPDGGYRLSELEWFETSNGSRYEVRQHETLDLIRCATDGGETIWMFDVDIGEQEVVEGAPLVFRYTDTGHERRIAFVFRVAALQVW